MPLIWVGALFLKYCYQIQKLSAQSEMMVLTKELPRLHATSGELLHLDLMQFIASAGIVFHHSHEFFTSAANRQYLLDRTSGLALFVDLFFIISGFVIAHIYHDRINSMLGYGEFLKRRVGRLVPLHWLVLFASIAIWSMFLLVNISANHLPSFKPECIAETALLLHSFVRCGRGITFNDPSWSISTEMVMYIAFPFIAIIGARSATVLLSAGVLSLTAMVAVVASHHDWSLIGSSWTELSPVLRAVPSFILGAALFYNRKLVSRLPVPGFILAGATVTLIFAMLSGLSQLLTLLIVYVVAVASVAADVECAPSAIVRRFAPLGQLTYSIYMWQSLFILVMINSVGDKLLHVNTTGAIVIAIICYVTLFLWSYFSFFFIETPARRWIESLDLVKVKALFRSFLFRAPPATPRPKDRRQNYR